MHGRVLQVGEQSSVSSCSHRVGTDVEEIHGDGH